MFDVEALLPPASPLAAAVLSASECGSCASLSLAALLPPLLAAAVETVALLLLAVVVVGETCAVGVVVAEDEDVDFFKIGCIINSSASS